MTEATIERYTDVDGAWRWRLVDDDEHVLADGATAHASAEALSAHLQRLREVATAARVAVVG
ncbi:MAG: DUF1508 domain-containing protein [Halobacteriales archaeon]